MVPEDSRSDGRTVPIPLSVPVTVDFRDGAMHGAPVRETMRTIGHLSGLFADESAHAALPADRLVYRVQAWCPVAEGARGGLSFGVTFLENGCVGDEYLMTKGHFHSRRETAEYYWCLKGEGLLLLMDEQRHCRCERMHPGSLHYVPGYTAHRTINTGDETLHFGACWPSDAGHDYESIVEQGFAMRAKCVDGRPQLVES